MYYYNDTNTAILMNLTVNSNLDKSVAMGTIEILCCKHPLYLCRSQTIFGLSG